MYDQPYCRYNFSLHARRLTHQLDIQVKSSIPTSSSPPLAFNPTTDPRNLDLDALLQPRLDQIERLEGDRRGQTGETSREEVLMRLVLSFRHGPSLLATITRLGRRYISSYTMSVSMLYVPDGDAYLAARCARRKRRGGSCSSSIFRNLDPTRDRHSLAD